MDQENIMFFENDDKSHTMVDLYLNDRFRVLNKRIIIPPQLKAKNFYNELNTFANNNRAMFIYNDDKEISRKCREIWNKIIELIGINNPIDFVDADDDANLLWQMYTKIQALLLKIIIHMGIIKTQ